MTADEVLEAMARAIAEASPCEMTQAEAMSAARAAIRALPAGWVVAQVPEDKQMPMRPMTTPEWDEATCDVDGWNAALAAVRASTVEVG